jgi:quinolinate synthase
VLESLLEDEVVNPIRVPDASRRWARAALDRMLDVQ